MLLSSSLMRLLDWLGFDPEYDQNLDSLHEEYSQYVTYPTLTWFLPMS